ncbi:MAG: ribonuclease E activity regulator RraA [Parvibaculum sp.]|uniref:ribonuclease E activity regulator RraA n=1 Tax=Parvibaculum sp. TaxID=2024848 RepID=UPI0025E7A22E|nr:ribonuclease E activity regulator RraA [Parvibaculum sp.]MCE9647985.1 ribonuclease E activity regulator RraA [Parvibaculum sp.]
MTSPATTDLSDAHPELVRHCAPVFRDYGGRLAFSGPVTTLKVFEDNAKVRAAVEGEGLGRVLVVDGGGSLNCALFGGNLAALAAQNGWAGVVVHGCIRDTGELVDAEVGVKALAAHPKRSARTGAGEVDVTVSFAGVTFSPGDWLYADADGIILSKTKLT